MSVKAPSEWGYALAAGAGPQRLMRGPALTTYEGNQGRVSNWPDWSVPNA